MQSVSFCGGPTSVGCRDAARRRARSRGVFRAGWTLYSALLFMPVLSFASPLPVRDQNPLLAGFGLPTALPAQPAEDGKWHVGIDFNWSSSAIEQSGADENLIVDAETRELRLVLQRSISRHWVARLELPYRYTGAGNLDGFIDSWHDFFGLPEGARPLMPRDRLDIAYVRDGNSVVDLTSAAEGMGDATVATGYRWIANDRAALAAWLNVKVPTGDADKLTGSGATDVSLALAGQYRLAERWHVFGQFSATWLGDTDPAVAPQHDVVVAGMVGAGYNAWRGLDLKVQFDAHSPAYESDLDYLGSAGILTLGGSYRFASGWQFDFGVSEDVVVDASPDVVFVFGVRR